MFVLAVYTLPVLQQASTVPNPDQSRQNELKETIYVGYVGIVGSPQSPA
jgi:hypothetical protein